MIKHRPGPSLPVNQGISHLGSNGTWLSFVQLEDTLDDGELGAGCIQPTEGTPVIDNHPCCNDLAAAIHRSSLTKTKGESSRVCWQQHVPYTGLTHVFSAGPQLALLKRLNLLLSIKLQRFQIKR